MSPFLLTQCLPLTSCILSDRDPKLQGFYEEECRRRRRLWYELQAFEAWQVRALLARGITPELTGRLLVPTLQTADVLP